MASPKTAEIARRLANSLFYKFAHMHQHAKAAELLEELDLGVSLAEIDTLLETARVETSAFADLLNDKVDLVPCGLMIQRTLST